MLLFLVLWKHIHLKKSPCSTLLLTSDLCAFLIPLNFLALLLVLSDSLSARPSLEFLVAFHSIGFLSALNVFVDSPTTAIPWTASLLEMVYYPYHKSSSFPDPGVRAVLPLGLQTTNQTHPSLLVREQLLFPVTASFMAGTVQNDL